MSSYSWSSCSTETKISLWPNVLTWNSESDAYPRFYYCVQAIRDMFEQLDFILKYAVKCALCDSSCQEKLPSKDEIQIESVELHLLQAPIDSYEANNYFALSDEMGLTKSIDDPDLKSNVDHAIDSILEKHYLNISSLQEKIENYLKSHAILLAGKRMYKVQPI